MPWSAPSISWWAPILSPLSETNAMLYLSLENSSWKSCLLCCFRTTTCCSVFHLYQGVKTIITPCWVQTSSARLAGGCSIFCAELYAVLLALQHIHHSSEHNILIISDSLSAVQAFLYNYFDNHFGVQLPKINVALIQCNKDIVFKDLGSWPCWYPGNVWSDQAAKDACQSPGKFAHWCWLFLIKILWLYDLGDWPLNF